MKRSVYGVAGTLAILMAVCLVIWTILGALIGAHSATSAFKSIFRIAWPPIMLAAFGVGLGIYLLRVARTLKAPPTNEDRAS